MSTVRGDKSFDHSFSNRKRTQSSVQASTPKRPTHPDKGNHSSVLSRTTSSGTALGATEHANGEESAFMKKYATQQ